MPGFSDYPEVCNRIDPSKEKPAEEQPLPADVKRCVLFHHVIFLCGIIQPILR